MAFWHKWFTRDSGEVDVWPMVEFPGNVTSVEIEKLPEPVAEEPAPFVPPEPDLSTKPPNTFEFKIAYSCSEHHYIFLVENVSVEPEMMRRIRICEVCGRRSRLAVVMVIREAIWTIRSGFWSSGRDLEASDYGWNPGWLSEHEFVRWLKKPTGK